MSWSQLYIVNRLVLAAASLLIATFTPTSSFAQSPIQQRNTCLGKDNPSAASRLAACVAIVEGAREQPNVMAAAHTVRGDAYRSKNEFDQAIEDYDQAIQLDSRFSLAFFGRGLARIGKGDTDRAIADFA